jgi:hypothetical protein
MRRAAWTMPAAVLLGVLLALPSRSAPPALTDGPEDTQIPSRLRPPRSDESPQAGTGQPHLPASLGKGLVLYYAFDKNERGKVTDLSGSGNHGTAHGATWVPKGVMGGALKFDGKRDYVDTENPLLADGFAEVTLAAWVCLSIYTPHAGIVCSRAAGPKTGEILALAEGDPDNDEAVFFVGNGRTFTGCTTASAGDLRTGVWHHLAATWKSKEAGGDGMTRIFLDGKPSNAEGHLEGLVAQRDSLKIGWDPFEVVSGENRHLNGLVDEVRVYRRALSPHEVEDLCQRTAPSDPRLSPARRGGRR